MDGGGVSYVGYTASNGRRVKRAAVALLVLSISGLPAVGVLCDVVCAPPAASTSAGPCHGHDTSQQRRLDAAGHHCDHIQGFVPFVPRLTSDGPMLQLPVEATVPAIARNVGAVRLVSHHTASPPGDSSLLHAFRTLRLRI